MGIFNRIVKHSTRFVLRSCGKTLYNMFYLGLLNNLQLYKVNSITGDVDTSQKSLLQIVNGACDLLVTENAKHNMNIDFESIEEIKKLANSVVSEWSSAESTLSNSNLSNEEKMRLLKDSFGEISKALNHINLYCNSIVRIKFNSVKDSCLVMAAVESIRYFCQSVNEYSVKTLRSVTMFERSELSNVYLEEVYVESQINSGIFV